MEHRVVEAKRVIGIGAFVLTLIISEEWFKFGSVAASDRYTLTHNIDPTIAPEKYELKEYYNIFRAFYQDCAKIKSAENKSTADTLSKELARDVDSLKFLPDWFDRNDPARVINKINTLDPQQIMTANILLVMFYKRYVLAGDVRRAKIYDDALQEHYRQVIRQAAAQAGQTISGTQLKEQAAHLKEKMPQSILVMEQIDEILQAAAPDALSAIEPDLAGLEQMFYLLAEDTHTEEHGLFNILLKYYTYRPELVLPGGAKLNISPELLNDTLARMLDKFEVLQADYYAENISYEPDNAAVLQPDGSCLPGPIVKSNIQKLRQADNYIIKLNVEEQLYDLTTINRNVYLSRESRAAKDNRNPFYNPLYQYMPKDTALGREQTQRTVFLQRNFDQLNALTAIEMKAARQASEKKQAYIHYHNAGLYIAEYIELNKAMSASRNEQLANDNEIAEARLDMQNELDALQTNLSQAALLPEMLEIMTQKKDYLSLYYAVREPEEKVWQNITVKTNNLNDALLLFNSPVIQEKVPNSFIQKLNAYIQADYARLVLLRPDAQEYQAALEIRDICAQTSNPLPDTPEAAQFLLKLRQIFTPPELHTGIALPPERNLSKPPAAAVSADIDTNVTPVERSSRIRVEATDIGGYNGFDRGFYRWENYVEVAVSAAEIIGMNYIDLRIDNNGYYPDFITWLNGTQFRNSSYNLIGFIWDSVYYQVDSSGIISAANPDDYRYNSDTGIISFHNEFIGSTIDSVDGNPFYNLAVSIDKNAGAITISSGQSDFSNGLVSGDPYKIYTLDGLIDIDISSSPGYYFYDISPEDFIIICQNGGLYIGTEDDSDSYAIIPPAAFVDNVTAPPEKFEIEIKDQTNSRLAAQYSDIFSVREISHTDITAATPDVTFKAAPVSEFFKPAIEYLGVGKGKARYKNGLLFGAGEVIVKVTYWDVDSANTPIQLQKEIKLKFPETAEYIKSDKVDLPSGLGLNYQDLPDSGQQVSRPVGMTLIQEIGGGYDNFRGFYVPMGLRFLWDKPMFTLKASLSDEFSPETKYHKLNSGISVLGAPFSGRPELQFFTGAQAENIITKSEYPVATGAKVNFGLLYDWYISPDLRWRNAIGGKFLTVMLDSDMQATAWKLEYESVLRYKRWSPYIKTGILFAQNKMFLAQDALYRDFTDDRELDQLEIGLSYQAFKYRDIFILNVLGYGDLAERSIGAGFNTMWLLPKKYRWDLGAQISLLELNNNPKTLQVNANSTFTWPGGFFLRAEYTQDRVADDKIYKAKLIGGMPIDF